MLVILIAVFAGYGVTIGSEFTYEPVVFAGSMKSKDTVHKITVYGHQHDLYPFLDGQKTMYSDNGELVYNPFVEGLAYKEIQLDMK